MLAEKMENKNHEGLLKHPVYTNQGSLLCIQASARIQEFPVY